MITSAIQQIVNTDRAELKDFLNEVDKLHKTDLGLDLDLDLELLWLISAIWILPLLGLDFICTDLESWTDEIFKTLLAVALTKVCGDFAVLTSWLAAYTLPTPPNTKAFK
jgi:hypothetical protein